MITRIRSQVAPSCKANIVFQKKYLSLETIDHADLPSLHFPPTPPEVYNEKNLDSLLAVNKAWVNRISNLYPTYLNHSRRGHAPKALWIGCSDARVPANELLCQPPGTVFVHRNIANQVINNDFSCMSAVQYAVSVLKVKHIIVAGHYDCGGVKASLTNVDHGSPLENWILNIRNVIKNNKPELDAIVDIEAKQRRLVELNTVEQALMLFKLSAVQERHRETSRNEDIGVGGFKEPRIHAVVVDPTTGQLTKLNINFSVEMRRIRGVYDLGK